MRVLVTRPEADARRTAEALAARGHEAFVAPLMAVEPTQARAPDELGDGIVLTSANGVPALARIRDRIAGRPIFAVGPRTAAAAEEAGLAGVRTADGDADALSRLIQGTLRPGSALLHVAGRERKAEPETSLRHAGYRILVWEAYQAVAATRLPDGLRAALANGRIEAALHFSRRSAAILIDLARAARLLDPLRGLLHGCLSDDVAAALSGLGAPRRIVARRPDEASLLDTLATVRATHGSPSAAPRC